MLSLMAETRFGLTRACVFLDDQPHLYAEGLEFDASAARLGVRSVARLMRRAGGVHYLRLHDGQDAVLDGPPQALSVLNEGTAVEVEIIAEAREQHNKAARARLIARSEPPPRALEGALSLKDRLALRAQALLGAMPETVDADGDRLDEAAAQARQPSGPLPGGGYLTIEPTTALISCDIDLGQAMARGGTPAARIRACNLEAMRALPRRLRLSGLAGLCVVDLIGHKHEPEPLRAALLEAFRAEKPRIIIAPIGRFGTIEFVRPWGEAPHTGPATPVRQALDLITAAVRLSANDRGRPLLIRALPAIADILRPRMSGATDPLAPMLRLEVGPVNEVRPL